MKKKLVISLGLLIAFFNKQIHAISDRDVKLATCLTSGATGFAVALFQDKFLDKKTFFKSALASIIAGISTKIFLEQSTPKNKLNKVKRVLDSCNWTILLELISVLKQRKEQANVIQQAVGPAIVKEDDDKNNDIFFDKVGRYYLKSQNPLSTAFYDFYNLTNNILIAGTLLTEIQNEQEVDSQILTEAKDIQKKIDSIDLKTVYNAMAIIRSNPFFRSH